MKAEGQVTSYDHKLVQMNICLHGFLFVSFRLHDNGLKNCRWMALPCSKASRSNITWTSPLSFCKRCSLVTLRWFVKYRVSNKKATQAFGSCSRTRVPILFKLTMNIVRKMVKIIVTKANCLDVLPHLECVLLRRLHFCYFHWTRRSLLKKFG